MFSSKNFNFLIFYQVHGSFSVDFCIQCKVWIHFLLWKFTCSRWIVERISLLLWICLCSFVENQLFICASVSALYSVSWFICLSWWQYYYFEYFMNDSWNLDFAPIFTGLFWLFLTPLHFCIKIYVWWFFMKEVKVGDINSLYKMFLLLCFGLPL